MSQLSCTSRQERTLKVKDRLDKVLKILQRLQDFKMKHKMSITYPADISNIINLKSSHLVGYDLRNTKRRKSFDLIKTKTFRVPLLISNKIFEIYNTVSDF